jgi:hypothetical protein
MAIPKAITKVQLSDVAVSLAVDSLTNAIESLTDEPLLGARLKTGVALTEGANVVAHGLGRTLRGWFVVGSQAGYAFLYDRQSTNPTPDKTLALTINGTVGGSATVNLIVF